MARVPAYSNGHSEIWRSHEQAQLFYAMEGAVRVLTRGDGPPRGDPVSKVADDLGIRAAALTRCSTGKPAKHPIVCFGDRKERASQGIHFWRS